MRRLRAGAASSRLLQRAKIGTLDGVHVTSLRLYVAIAAVVAGGLLLLLTVTSTANAIRLVSEILGSPQPYFVSIVVPPAWNGLLLYGIGVLGNVIFRGAAVPLGRQAEMLWRTHLVFTTLLIVLVFASEAVAPIDWRMALALSGLYVLMLVAHGSALVFGGVLFLRSARV